MTKWLNWTEYTGRASRVAQLIKNLPEKQETWVHSMGWEDSLEEDMVTHSSILAWRIPMDRGAWQATVHEVTKSDTTEWLNTVQHNTCWSWRSNTLATWCEELTHWKRLWHWDRLEAGGEGDDGGWDSCMGSPTQWTWLWVNSGSWWWTGRPDMLQSMGSQRVRHDWVTELNW